MEWTEEQCYEIFESYWKTGSAECPADGSLVDLNRTRHFGGYFLIARCPQCGQQMRMGRDDDPKKGAFRQWTESEQRQFVDSYFKIRIAGICPICQASVEIKS